MPHIASARGAFNVRFAQPTRLSGTQHTEQQFAGPESPMTWGTSQDSIADIKGGQLDRGPLFNAKDITGVTEEPPLKGADYVMLVPQVDADGNDIDGLRNVNVQVPLGTYTGWNIRKAGFSEGDSCDLTGAFIPFFKTQAERMTAGDPRLSLEERYPTHADYVAKITAAANGLVKKRLLLQEDADDIIAAASAAAVPQ